MTAFLALAWPSQGEALSLRESAPMAAVVGETLVVPASRQMAHSGSSGRMATFMLQAPPYEQQPHTDGVEKRAIVPASVWRASATLGDTHWLCASCGWASLLTGDGVDADGAVRCLSCGAPRLALQTTGRGSGGRTGCRLYLLPLHRTRYTPSGPRRTFSSTQLNTHGVGGAVEVNSDSGL